MFTFIILYFLNLVLDYPLQGTFLAEYKCKNNYILFVHCAIWALGIYIALYFLGLATVWKLVMLLVGIILLTTGNVEAYIRNIWKTLPLIILIKVFILFRFYFV